jgi:hypothetical protein
VFGLAHATITSVGEHTGRAVLQADAARQALADADSQALQTIPEGAGPVGQYQDDVAAAEQSMEQVAENNAAGAAGSRALQLTEGLLTAYTALIEQADAHYRIAGQSGVGLEDLASASNLMHNQILTGPGSLSDLVSAQRGALAAQRSSPWASPWLNALWVVPAIALLATLTATQLVLYRRLRRALSRYLTLAAAALLALSVVTWHAAGSEQALASALAGPLDTMITLHDFQTVSTDEQGQQTFAKSSCSGQCAPARAAQEIANRDTRELAGVAAKLTRADCPNLDKPGCITNQQRAYDTQVATAEAGYSSRFALIAALAVLLLLLIPIGLLRHLDEYRYRPR